MTMVAS